MPDKSKQELMARYHHLRDYINGFDSEIDVARKELNEVITALFEKETQ